MFTRLSIFLLLAGLLPASAFARDGVSAAVTVRDADVMMDFDDGALEQRALRRAGIEYWEPVAEYLQMGFTIGYSENDVDADVRPVGAVGGQYGSLGARMDWPLGARFDLRAEAEVLWQRDRHSTSAFEFEARTREARVDVSPVVQLGIMEFALGASWRDIDYRETLREEDGDNVRRAEADSNAGAFAAVGVHTDNDGTIALRYDDGAETGWSLRFERTF